MKFQFTPEYLPKNVFSDKCCEEFKKKIFWEIEKTTGKVNALTGQRIDEKGNRDKLSCISQGHNGKHFNILAPNEITTEWIWWFINKFNIPVCELYLKPFNFDRLGCICCPFSRTVQKELDTLEIYAPNLKKQAEILWKPSFSEMRRIGYRLRKKGSAKQTTIFDFMD